MQQQTIYSEADSGDMSHYDPNLGIKYPKTNNQMKQTHKKKLGTTKLPKKGTGLKSSPKIMKKEPSGTRTIKPSTRKKSATIVQKNREGGQKYRFPMPDKAHARNALARLNQAKGLSSSQKAMIKSRAERMLGNKEQIKRSLRKTMGYE